MKLLLVDDERFTREGIYSLTPWKELGIDEVITAEDGEDGLEKALLFAPEIILTDVKMPRMDGVDMSFKIREKFPDCSIIFMSGYADKEYLKSAIRLSAVNYIEKPFQPEELHSTLRIAAEKYRSQAARENSANELTHKLNLSLPAIRTKIAIALLHPSVSGKELDEYIRIAYPNLRKEGSWITFLILLLGDKDETAGNCGSIQDAICDLLDSRLALSDFSHVIIGQKSDQIIVVHMNLTDPKGEPVSSSQIGNICYMLCDILKSTCRFLLATGHPVNGFEQIYDSYQTASICLQRGFFHKENAVLFYEEKHNHLVYQFSEDILSPFEKALRQHDEKAACSYVVGLVEKLRRFDGTLVSSVKNFFIRAYSCLYDFSRLYGSTAFADEESPETLTDRIWKMSFLSDMEQELLHRLHIFFHSTDDRYTQFPLAYQLRLYIDENYEKEDLSLQGIAEQFSVSESYLCVIFKKAFDYTINQYIIDRRIEKAKDYLKNSNKKIKEISDLVGYRDCNYFIRIFKKTTGITPADYRSS